MHRCPEEIPVDQVLRAATEEVTVTQMGVAITGISLIHIIIAIIGKEYAKMVQG
jgi:hypothetical protein